MKGIKKIMSIALILMLLATSQGIVVFASSGDPAVESTKEDPGSQSAGISEADPENDEEVSLQEDEEAISDGEVKDDADADAEISDDREVQEELSEDEDIRADEEAEADEAAEAERKAAEEKGAAEAERAASPMDLGFVPGEIIIEYDSSRSMEEMEYVVQALAGTVSEVIMESEDSSFAIVRISEDTRVQTAIEAYEALPQIRSAGKNAVARFSSYDENGTDDFYSDKQYSLKSRTELTPGGANVFRAWDRLEEYQNAGNELEPVGVTVIDSGCRTTHEDLTREDGTGVINMEKSYEIFSDLTLHPLLGDNYNDGVHYERRVSHGTHVTGIIGAVANNEEGIAGAASFLGSKLDLSVIDAAENDEEEDDDVFTTAALIKAVGVAKDNGARVVNMSVGATIYKWQINNFVQLKNALDEVYRQGVVVVCAAGNESVSDNYVTIPSDYDSTISVIATDKNARRCDFSNYGSYKDVCAPGKGITSTYGYTDYMYADLDGTSMASPLVAGVAALMLSVDPSLTPREVKTILRKTAVDLGDEGFDAEYAAGLIDAEMAVLAVINETEFEDDYSSGIQIINDNPGGGGGGGSTGGGGGGGGGSVVSGSSGAVQAVIAGSMIRNPLTGKQMFVSQSGQTYRNAWLYVEVKDAEGKTVKTWIYVDANGDLVAGWQWIRGKDGQIRRSYFSEAKDATYGFCYLGKAAPDGNIVDSNGYWTVNGVVQLAAQESVSRIPALDPNEAAKAAAERAKSSSELGYVPGQLIFKTKGTRQQIKAYVALMGGTVAAVTDQADGTSLVVVNVAAHTTVATAEVLYKANPLFAGVTKNYVLKAQ